MATKEQEALAIIHKLEAALDAAQKLAQHKNPAKRVSMTVDYTPVRARSMPLPGEVAEVLNMAYSDAFRRVVTGQQKEDYWDVRSHGPSEPGISGTITMSAPGGRSGRRHFISMLREMRREFELATRWGAFSDTEPPRAGKTEEKRTPGAVLPVNEEENAWKYFIRLYFVTAAINESEPQRRVDSFRELMEDALPSLPSRLGDTAYRQLVVETVGELVREKQALARRERTQVRNTEKKQPVPRRNAPPREPRQRLLFPRLNREGEMAEDAILRQLFRLYGDYSPPLER